MNPSEQVRWLAEQINQVPPEKTKAFEGGLNDVRVEVRECILMSVGLQPITDILKRADKSGKGQNFRLTHCLGWAMVALTYQRKIYRDIIIRALDPFKELGIDVRELYPHLKCLNRTKDVEVVQQ